jgi:hypothetical protein
MCSVDSSVRSPDRRLPQGAGEMLDTFVGARF